MLDTKVLEQLTLVLHRIEFAPVPGSPGCSRQLGENLDSSKHFPRAELLLNSIENFNILLAIFV